VIHDGEQKNAKAKEIFKIKNVKNFKKEERADVE